MTYAIPRFRSGEFRDLARLAASQGWDVYQRKGGHVSVVNPRTGAHVVMSQTAVTAAHGLANARQALIRGGLVLDRGHRRRRQEVQPMQVREVTPPPPLAIVPIPPEEDRRRGRVPLDLESREALSIGGRRVVISRKADGRWAGSTRDDRYKTGRRSWAGADRDSMVERIARDLAEEAAQEEALVAESATRLADVHLDPEEEALEGLAQAVHAVEDGPLPGWHVVQAGPEEFPQAAALDRLDQALAPGLAALEAAGRQDAADLVRAELVRTPLEEELLRLYRRVMTGD